MNSDLSPASAADDPGQLVELAVTRVLELARTWIVWDGAPRLADDAERIYTPHKAIRRHADHLIDHLAQIEAILAGQSPRPNGWHESRVTTDSDWARFTEADLTEATERLTRLSTTVRLRLLAAGADAWDTPRDDQWTLRQIAVHLARPWYAEQVGDLTRAAAPAGGATRDQRADH